MIRRCVLIVKVLLLVAGMGATSLLFILVYDALTQHAYFEARTITVEGNQRLSKEAILKQARLKPRDNVLSVNLRTVRYRLLADPWIASAEVERDLPDTIRIRVKERVPIAIVDLRRRARPPAKPARHSPEAQPMAARGTDGQAEQGGPGESPPAIASSPASQARRGGQGHERAGVAGRRFYLDGEGEIFKAVEASDQIRVPVVTGLRLSDIDLSDHWRPGLFRAVMEVLRLRRLHGNLLPFRSLHRLHVDPEMGLTLFVFDSGLAIKLGFGDYKSKYDRLRDMISYLRREDQLLNIDCVDLNDLDRVVVRPSEGVSLLGVCHRKEM